MPPGLPATTQLIDERLCGAPHEVDAIQKLRGGTGVAVAISRDSLEKVYDRIADLDPVVRRFPTEEIYVGIAKDHTEAPEEFDLLEIRVGMDRDAAMAALDAEFGAGSVTEAGDGRLVAGAADCLSNLPPRPGRADEAGARCAALALRDGAVASVALWQVIGGDMTEAVLAALKDSFGRSYLLHEVRFLEGTGRREIRGWGAVLPAERQTLGRVDSRLPASAAEGVIWLQDGLTTIHVQIDAAPVTAALGQAEAPPIKF